MHETIHIKQAGQANEDILSAMQRLMTQLTSAPPPNIEELQEMLGAGATTTLFLARQADNTIIGMAALSVFRVPSGLKAWIEDVVVDEAHRGKGIGEALTEACIEHARALGVHSIHLTSNPARVAANQLYQKLGFQLHETNLYQLRLS
ncbi:MAG: GNAT family N-acetyltransferase [Anaerolineaceae bacterium]|nr:GNAT family N-acetyltransferase [Anaerolineaceae bacterium]